MGYLVNEKMETSVEDVYALGDCVESRDLILQANIISHLGTTVVRESKTLAHTITGKKDNFYPVLNAMVSKAGKLEFGAVGLTSSFLLNKIILDLLLRNLKHLQDLVIILMLNLWILRLFVILKVELSVVK